MRVCLPWKKKSALATMSLQKKTLTRLWTRLSSTLELSHSGLGMKLTTVLEALLATWELSWYLFPIVIRVRASRKSRRLARARGCSIA